MEQGVLVVQLLQAEAADPGERDQIAPVFGFRERRDPPDGADGRQRRRAVRSIRRQRLDHADDALSGQRVVDHVEIARLENVERQRAARKHQRPAQRKQRHALRQIGCLAIAECAHENRMDDNLRRPCLATSDAGPAASNIFSNCLRAASSFQSRCISMMASRCSTAPPRSPRAASVRARS